MSTRYSELSLLVILPAHANVTVVLHNQSAENLRSDGQSEYPTRQELSIVRRQSRTFSRIIYTEKYLFLKKRDVLARWERY